MNWPRGSKSCTGIPSSFTGANIRFQHNITQYVWLEAGYLSARAFISDLSNHLTFSCWDGDPNPRSAIQPPTSIYTMSSTENEHHLYFAPRIGTAITPRSNQNHFLPILFHQGGIPNRVGPGQLHRKMRSRMSSSAPALHHIRMCISTHSEIDPQSRDGDT